MLHHRIWSNERESGSRGLARQTQLVLALRWLRRAHGVVHAPEVSGSTKSILSTRPCGGEGNRMQTGESVEGCPNQTACSRNRA